MAEYPAEFVTADTDARGKVVRIGGLVSFTDPLDQPGSAVNVTDGTHEVISCVEVDFTSGATVTDAGSGIAQVAITPGVNPLGFAGQVYADAATAVTGDGTPHSIAPILASPPSWMDTSGNLTASGLYAAAAYVTVTAAATDTALQMFVQGPFLNAQQFTLIKPYFDNSRGFTVIDVGSIADADLPFGVSFTALIPTDATAAITLQPSVWKLA